MSQADLDEISGRVIFYGFVETTCRIAQRENMKLKQQLVVTVGHCKIIAINNQSHDLDRDTYYLVLCLLLVPA